MYRLTNDNNYSLRSMEQWNSPGMTPRFAGQILIRAFYNNIRARFCRQVNGNVVSRDLLNAQ